MTKCPMDTYIDEEGLAVEQVGELVESLGHNSLAGFWDVQLARDHDIISAILGGQEEDTVCVGFVVQEGDPSLTYVIGVVLHFNHQIYEGQDGIGGKHLYASVCRCLHHQGTYIIVGMYIYKHLRV